MRSRRCRSQNRDQAVEKVKSGGAVAALVIPPDFAVKLSSGGFASASIEVIYNGDALKLSLVDTTITAKLAAADAELSGQISRLANGYIDVLLDGGAIDVLGTHFPILGLKNSTARIDAVLADKATAANKRRLGPVSKFAHLALANADRATAVLSTVTGAGPGGAHDPQRAPDPARRVRRGRRGGDVADVRMRPARVGPARARTRGEHVLAARARPRLGHADPRRQDRARRGVLDGRHARDAPGGQHLRPPGPGRIGLWLIALSGSAIAFATLGVAIGSLAREVRAASLLAFGLALPIAFLALVPSGGVAPLLYDVIRVISAVFPFKAVARGDRRRGQRLVAGHRPGARAPRRARRPVRRGGALRAAALRLSRPVRQRLAIEAVHRAGEGPAVVEVLDPQRAEPVDRRGTHVGRTCVARCRPRRPPHRPR